MARQHAVRYLREAAEKLEGLDGVLDRARDNAGGLHDAVESLQHDVQRATQRALSLMKQLEED